MHIKKFHKPKIPLKKKNKQSRRGKKRRKKKTIKYKLESYKTAPYAERLFVWTKQLIKGNVRKRTVSVENEKSTCTHPFGRFCMTSSHRHTQHEMYAFCVFWHAMYNLNCLVCIGLLCTNVSGLKSIETRKQCKKCIPSVVNSVSRVLYIEHCV